ncbi:MAG: ornithine carbamoyltransferase [Planctomycetaceae bacterium]|nr:ornithine carbamoyltransferase [Planctomycetaceae bacterium]
MTHLISLQDFDRKQVKSILETSAILKQKFRDDDRPQPLAGYFLTQIFDKPSLRTRTSFEAAMVNLGGNGIFMTSEEAGLNGRESLEDVARVLSSFTDVITIRTFSHQFIIDFSKYSSVPVINALSDELHPCQALADILTVREAFGEDPKDRRLVYIGDGNNVAASLCNITAILEIPMTVCTPDNYTLSGSFLESCQQHYPDADLVQTTDLKSAVKDACVLYTDVWASMGQEKEAAQRKKDFAPYQINEEVLLAAPKDCKFLHCLPAKRGLEVTDGVMESSQSMVFQQAENRMHIARGLFHWLLVK